MFLQLAEGKGRPKLKAPSPAQYDTEHRTWFLVFNTLFGLKQFNSPTVT